MRITYDPEADALSIRIREGEYREGNELTPSIIVHSDEEGNVLEFEILNARHVLATDKPLQIEVELLHRLLTVATEVETATEASTGD
jgi:uncharacterized protein YuzE